MKTLRSVRLWPIIAFLILAACQMVYAAPAVTVKPTSGPPTTGITAQGSGFFAFEVVDVYFDTRDLVLSVTSETGGFSCSLKTPRSAIPGVHWITAVGRKSGSAAQKPFTVRSNWAMFRYGPQHNGFNPYENVLSPSNVDELNLAWSYTTDGLIFSSPAVANGLVFVGSLASAGGKLYALNAQTGAKRWDYTMEGGIDTSPAVANGLVYVGDDKLYALDATTGAFKWSYDLGGGISSSPAVANGVVYVVATVNVGGYPVGKLCALDASTGAFHWSYTGGSHILSSPAVVNGVVYVGCNDGKLYALNALTGAFQWSYAANDSISSSPAVANGLVYVGSWGSKLYALNALTGAFQWSYTTGNGITSSPAVANGLVYLGSNDGRLYALDALTGAFRWSYATASFISSSPAGANGVVYVGSEDHMGFGHLYALNAQTGAMRWSYTTGGPISSSPAVTNGVVYVGSEDGILHAYSRDPQWVYGTIIRQPDPAELIPDLRLEPQVGKGAVRSSEELK